MSRIKLPTIFASSTREFLKVTRSTREYSIYDFIHGYIYARWPYLYISIGTREHPAAKKIRPLISWFDNIRSQIFKQPGNGKEVDPQDKITFADNYHGKVVPLEYASQLVQINKAIDLPNLEQVIPYKRAKDIIMRNPDHIVALECPCRVSRQSPCLPLDVCLIIGEPFAGFVIEHHPSRANWISQEDAVEILREEDERGHVHHAFFKDAMFGRFYAICNCCSCCCGAMQAHRGGTPMLASSGYIAKVKDALCRGCGTCVDFCQFEAISVPNGHSVIDPMTCKGCGICVGKCEQRALKLFRDKSRAEPLKIMELMESATILE